MHFSVVSMNINKKNLHSFIEKQNIFANQLPDKHFYICEHSFSFHKEVKHRICKSLIEHKETCIFFFVSVYISPDWN